MLLLRVLGVQTMSGRSTVAAQFTPRKFDATQVSIPARYQ